MGFSNLIFLFLIMPIFLPIYYWISNNKKNIFLLLVSFLILFWNAPIISFVMLAIACLNFSLCFLMYRLYFLNNMKKYVFSALVLMNAIFFVIFLFLKLDRLIYFPEKLISKVMISLFFFSNISYILDIYRKKCKLQRNIIDFLTYIFAFPKMFAGPIVQYNAMEDQLKKRTLSLQNFLEGTVLFIVGFAQKCILADGIGEAREFILYPTIQNISVSLAWVGVIVEFFYIYFYFYGYANMAKGLGQVLGFEFPYNFRFVLSSNSITNFFERFNTSLLYWIKTYSKICFNSTKFLAKIIFLFFGGLIYASFFGGGFSKCFSAIYFVVLLFFERVFMFDILVKWPQWVRRIYTFVLVLFGTVLFWQNSVGNGYIYIKAMLGESRPFLDKSFVFFITSFAFILFFCWLFATNIVRSRVSKLKNKHEVTYVWLKYICSIVLFVISVVFCITNSN